MHTSFERRSSNSICCLELVITGLTFAWLLICRCHRGLRHYWGLRVKGQKTKTTGRRGRTVGVAKKRGG